MKHRISFQRFALMTAFSFMVSPAFARAAEEDQLFRVDTMCWIACYQFASSGDPESVGLFPLPGRYEGRLCLPKEHERDDISQVADYRSYCAQLFPQICAGHICWAGGDTGGYDNAGVDFGSEDE